MFGAAYLLQDGSDLAGVARGRARGVTELGWGEYPLPNQQSGGRMAQSLIYLHAEQGRKGQVRVEDRGLDAGIARDSGNDAGAKRRAVGTGERRHDDDKFGLGRAE